MFYVTLQAGLVLLHVRVVKLVAPVALGTRRVHARGRLSSGPKETGKMKRVRISASRDFHPISRADSRAPMAGVAVFFTPIFPGFDPFRARVNGGKRSGIGELISNFALKEQQERRNGQSQNP